MKNKFIPIFITVIMTGLGSGVAAPLVPLIIKSAGADVSTIGFIATTMFLFFTLSSLYVGKIVDKIGTKTMMLIGLGIYSFSYFILPFIEEISLFFILRAIQGVGMAALFLSVEAAINIMSDASNRVKNMSYYALFYGAGAIGGPVIGAILFTINIFLPFYLTAVFCILGLIFVLFFFEDLKIEITSPNFTYKKMINVLKIPIAAALSYSFIEISLASLFTIFLYEIEIKGLALGIIFALFALGGVISPIPSGILASKIGKTSVISLCGIILIGVTYAFTQIFNFYVVGALALCTGFVAGALYPVALAFIGDSVPKDRMGTANSLFTFTYGLGSIIGPSVVGVYMNFFGVKSMFYPMTFVSIIFVVVILIDRLTFKKSKRDAA
jgi:MFS family permease